MQLRRVEKILVARTVDEVLTLLWDVASLAKYGPRVEVLHVRAETPSEGTYVVRGNLGGMPWTGTFLYRLHERGFDSHLIRGPEGMRAEIRVKVRPHRSGRAQVIHIEQYEIPVPEFPLLEWAPPWSRREDAA